MPGPRTMVNVVVELERLPDRVPETLVLEKVALPVMLSMTMR